MTAGRFHARIMPNLEKLDSRNMQTVIQHLAKEQGFLETIFNTIGEAILVVGRDLKILYHNAAAKHMLGLPDQLDSLPVSKLLRGVDWAALLPPSGADKNAPPPPLKTARQELVLNYPEERVVQFYALPLAGPDTRYVLILNDVTATLQRAASSAETERSNIVSMLAAGVAHEIGNPLNSLYLHLQMLQRQASGDGELNRTDLRDELAEARAEVERLDTIIRQFLHAVRPGKPDPHAIDLKVLILESLNFMRHEIGDRAIKVNFVWGDNVPMLLVDPGQLKQAFYNLVKNALQSMPDGGFLGISCHADDDAVFLEVSDSGSGISKENLARIFHPYYTTKTNGTGLGLMIVERIVRDHGGSLAVDSEEGVGTTFTIRLPRFDRQVKILPPPKPESPHSTETTP